MREKLDNIAYIHHIADRVEKITEYAKNHTQEEFINNEWDQAALMRHLEIVGEAANNLESEFRAKYPEVQWRKIIDLRNVLIHNYLEVDIEIMWSIVSHDIPLLKREIDAILLSP